MLAVRNLQRPLCNGLASARFNSTIAGTLYYRISYHDPARTALVCPHEGVKWDYGQFWKKVESVAGGLKKLGYSAGNVIATDLSNSVANVLLQLAVAHNGMRVLTVKSKEEFDSIAPRLRVQGAVMANSSSFLSTEELPMQTIDAKGLQELTGKASEGATDRNADLAYYSSPDPVTNREVYLYGVGTAGLLETQPDDRVCVAANLNHPYGMGMVISAIVRSAEIHLADMNNLDVGDCTLLVTDKHHIKALAATLKPDAKLRGGLVKVGSGSDVLGAREDPEKDTFGSAQLFKLGSADQTFRPLFDPCVDKYYSYK